ncbi:unnamed protein product [Thelazia callipaeda]|uniref:SCP domain-containing protein n=1 Tax=Thelazia callipaeda TaxID=103827 RepID=A0A0N5CZ43_THECL|nr:unnamed protein product [Thelazia callipaeda]
MGCAVIIRTQTRLKGCGGGKEQDERWRGEEKEVWTKLRDYVNGRGRRQSNMKATFTMDKCYKRGVQLNTGSPAMYSKGYGVVHYTNE